MVHDGDELWGHILSMICTILILVSALIFFSSAVGAGMSLMGGARAPQGMLVLDKKEVLTLLNLVRSYL